MARILALCLLPVSHLFAKSRVFGAYRASFPDLSSVDHRVAALPRSRKEFGFGAIANRGKRKAPSYVFLEARLLYNFDIITRWRTILILSPGEEQFWYYHQVKDNFDIITRWRTILILSPGEEQFWYYHETVKLSNDILGNRWETQTLIN